MSSLADASRPHASRLDTLVPPPVWALGGALLQRLFPARRPPTWVRAVSLLILVASVALGIQAVRGFRDHGTTIDPHHIHDVTSLVTSGAHSVSRNPMYTALLGSLVSIALWRGRAAALLPVAAVWFALNRFQVAPEEASLAEAFGEQFENYSKAVPRWL